MSWLRFESRLPRLSSGNLAMRTRPLAPALLLALAGHARAQHVLETFYGVPNNLPPLAADGGDADGDGYADVLVRSPSSNSTNRVWLYNGRRSAPLFQITARTT
jgi:hypothetical protein